MKDFVLSLLSRGYGQIVPNEDGHDGRLEVCFEPEDYFNWKSQPPLLRLTSSGRFFGGLDPVPPKTYSTRRGPLILYSEDLALAYRSGQVNRKRKALSCPKQEVEKQLHTLQDLTGAILAFGKNKSKVGSLAGVTHPLLPDTKHAIQNVNMRHRPGDKNSSQVKDEQLAFKTGKTGKDRKRALKSLRIAVDTCRAHMSPIPETEAARTEPAHQTPETKKTTPTILPHQIDHPKDLNGRGKRSRMESGGGVGETCTLRSVYVDSSQEYSPLSRVNYYGGHMEGSRQMRHCGGETHMRRVNTETDPSFTVFHLPPINQSPLVKSGSDITLTLNKTDIKEKKSSCENLPKRELHVHLPDIKVGTAHENPSERRVHSKVLLLFPAQTEHADTHQPDDDLHRTPVKETEPRLKHALGPDQRKQDPLSDNKCRIIEMDLGHVMWSDELEKGDQHPPLGPLPPLVGRRGPGKQSSMAVYRQNLHDPADETEGQTGNTRGCLPLELREWQGGKAVGTLIMGPDGEIIRLSLWDPAVDTEDHPIMADVTQEEDTTSNTEETSNTEQLDSSHEGFKVNKTAEKTNAKKKQHPLGSHNKTDRMRQVFRVKGRAQQNNAEDDEDDLDSDSQISQKERVIKVRPRAKQTKAKRKENRLGADNEISQENQVFKVKARAKQTNAKRDDCLGADSEVIQEEEVFKVRSRINQTNIKRKDDCSGADNEIIHEAQTFKMRSQAKQTKAKRKKDCFGSDSEIIQDEQVYLPEERLEEMSSSTTHRLNKTGKPRPQDTEWMANPANEPEKQMSHERAVMTHDSEDDDDQLENTENTQEHNYTAFEDDMDADTDSESADTHEAHECSPRSVYSTYRSEHSLITARSDASIHRLSQSSIRTTSMGTLSHCGPCSPAPLSLIHLPPQSALPPASDPTKSEPGNDRAALEQHLKFHRGLFVEAEGLEQTQDISRPWIFSYFTLLKLLGLAEPTSEDTLNDVL
ncbi:titin-like protein [Labeo rohita]|uniref:Titin-like protein n=1 Tax=Labeo rohita TaxID=84645 RepID=A0A498N763_LABRO|nr:titin-like protein [Labeo rohita]